ncbi:uncharacterized protein LOC107661947 [Sinocyclocheilus anshuiensis]|uniref:uncharacterized protein LOC107661947 n=1 Tax=Sinocyclocheilus anshuiensis TaxID=1608454 RepID=UPI0007BAA8A7|nr:PREDICTED: uncharacterized protein LOC107661947 [Sinocyclocheilus anshuiensis]
MRVFCSSEGDQILYSWTLNGGPLMDGNSSIDLDEGTDGNISCSVKNHVSHRQKTVSVKPCPAPIGSVEVSISCSSSGAMRVFCFSEGDQILYSWTLNGGPLMDGNSSIDLDERTDGNISCSVKNHVSHRQKTVSVKPCPVLHVSLIALGFVALILFLLFITVYHIYKKKQVKSTPESLPAADVEYVEIQPQKKRKERKEKEEEVQYGEVTFTLNPSIAYTRPQEECIYSQSVVRGGLLIISCDFLRVKGSISCLLSAKGYRDGDAAAASSSSSSFSSVTLPQPDG